MVGQQEQKNITKAVEIAVRHETLSDWKKNCPKENIKINKNACQFYERNSIKLFWAIQHYEKGTLCYIMVSYAAHRIIYHTAYKYC